MELTISNYDSFSVILSNQNDYHRRKKIISPELVEKARANKPFDNLFNEMYKGVNDIERFEKGCSNFLKKNFVRLGELGINLDLPSMTIESRKTESTESIQKVENFFDKMKGFFGEPQQSTYNKPSYQTPPNIPNNDKTLPNSPYITTLNKDKQLIEETIKLYKNVSHVIATDYELDWKALCDTKALFYYIKPYAKFDSLPGHPIYHLFNVIKDIYNQNLDTEESKKKRNSQLSVLNRLVGMYDKIDEFPIILPKKNLVEIMLACPIWYEKERDYSFRNNYIHHIGDLDMFYSLLNYEQSFIAQYNGNDLIPRSILEKMPKLESVFGTLVIATPYHSKSKSFSRFKTHYVDPNPRPVSWDDNIDPYLLGFEKNFQNHFFMIHRWSKTGIFPLVDDMIADTISYIKYNLEHHPKMQNIQDYNLSLPNAGFGNGYKYIAMSVIKATLQSYINKFDSGNLIYSLRQSIK